MITAPWIGYCKTVPSYKGLSTPTDHATRDGLKALCGVTLAGAERSVAFDRWKPFACRRCVGAVVRESAARLDQAAQR